MKLALTKSSRIAFTRLYIGSSVTHQKSVNDHKRFNTLQTILLHGNVAYRYLNSAMLLHFVTNMSVMPINT